MGSRVPIPLVALFLASLLGGVGFCCGFVHGNDSQANNSTLELVYVLFRHGPRTPVNTYPNDPHVKETFFPYGWGHLTNDAKRELFKMGIWLSRRYRDLLRPYYHNDLLHAQSSASPRTIMSLQTLVAGMFPPKKTPMEWDLNYNWQPVPVYSDPLDTDVLLRMTAACPRYDQAVEEVMRLPEVQAEFAAHADLFRELTNITGMPITNANDINSIYITLLAELGYGLTLPEWTKDYFPERMEFMAAQNYIYNAYTTEMRRIKGGPFLEKMLREMREREAGSLKPAGRRLFLYCGHDWTITNVLSALDVWQRRMPRFSAMVLFELHRDPETDDRHVEIYFKNDPSGEVEQLTVPDCEFQCPLEKLIQLTREVMPTGSYHEMCRPLGS